MVELDKKTLSYPSPPSNASPLPPLSSSYQSKFDPNRMISIIKRKAVLKELAAAYHTECCALCQELLELQKKKQEPFLITKIPEYPRKETLRSAKLAKKMQEA